MPFFEIFPIDYFHTGQEGISRDGEEQWLHVANGEAFLLSGETRGALEESTTKTRDGQTDPLIEMSGRILIDCALFSPCKPPQSIQRKYTSAPALENIQILILLVTTMKHHPIFILGASVLRRL